MGIPRQKADLGQNILKIQIITVIYFKVSLKKSLIRT